MMKTLNYNKVVFKSLIPWVRAALFIVLLVLSASKLSIDNTSKAQSIDDIYSIVAIDVDVTDRTANRAKTIAFGEAETRAFYILINKLLPLESVALVVLPEGQRISNYVAGIEVISERNSKTRYLATLNVSFNATSIRELFANLNLAYSEISAPPTLLLPLYNKAGVPVLWGEENKTMVAFKAFADKNSLIQFKLPKGNFRERFQIQANDLIRGKNIERLIEFRKAYNVQRVIILVVQDGLCDNGKTCLRYKWHFANNPLEITTGDTGPKSIVTLTEENQDPSIPNTDTNDDVPVETVEVNVGDQWPALVQSLTKQMATEWMEKTKTFYGQYQTLQVSIRILKIEDWVNVRNKLNNVPVIQEVSLDELSLPTSLVYIRHIGGLEQLRQGLLKVGLNLKEDMDKVEGWRLQLVK